MTLFQHATVRALAAALATGEAADAAAAAEDKRRQSGDRAREGMARLARMAGRRPT